MSSSLLYCLILFISNLMALQVFKMVGLNSAQNIALTILT
jgi:hypothetical protein